MTIEATFGAGMSVIVIRDSAHVVVNTHFKLKMSVHHNFQLVVKALLHIFWRMWVVWTPHHHWHTATLAFGYPALIIFKEPLRHSCGFAQLAGVSPKDAHITTFQSRELRALPPRMHQRNRLRLRSFGGQPTLP